MTVDTPLTWDQYFTNMAMLVAQKSQDESKRYGAVVVDRDHRVRSTGYNGIPKGMIYQEHHHSRPDKYMYFVHAEQNAIFNAAGIGTSLQQCIMYVIDPPCVECVKAIVQSGITEIVYKLDHPDFVPQLDKDDWRLTLGAAQDILHRTGTVIRKIK